MPAGSDPDGAHDDRRSEAAEEGRVREGGGVAAVALTHWHGACYTARARGQAGVFRAVAETHIRGYSEGISTALPHHADSRRRRSVMAHPARSVRRRDNGNGGLVR